MNAHIINNVVVSLMVGGLCMFGVPGVALSDPCTTEYHDTDFASCATGQNVSGANTYGFHEKGTNITSYRWELEPWGAGPSKCEESGGEPSEGTSNQQWEKIENCNIDSTGDWYYSTLDYVAGGQPKTASPVWFW